jgi:hypothetical protein
MPATRTANIAQTESGLVIVRINDGAHQTLADAKDNLSCAVSETGGRRSPLLIDIRTAGPLDADARHHYSGQTLVEHFTALSLLIDASPFGRMMGNIYLRIAKPGIPTRLFSDEAEAVKWLSGYRL